MRWLPNLLTCVRIALTPALVYLIVGGRCRAALFLSVVAGVTDAADGFLARRFGWMSRLGAYLDPIADKLMLVSVYVALAISGAIPHFLLWLVVGRDILILSMAVAGILLTSIRDFPPTIWGKISTAIQIAGALVFLCECAGLAGGETAKSAAIVAIAAATAWSGVHYVWRGFWLLLRSAE